LSDQPPSNKTEITGGQLLIAVIFMPVVVVWLILAARIIWSASSNPETLDNIEGLLTALAVLTIPVSGGLAKVFESFGKD
jgi:ABC-type transport system involved in cytochrome c biogenesis permease component|tara:strand:+ start:215 stop:454 length:240 start_codon:yes stop_codon:yes gene_type:complete